MILIRPCADLRNNYNEISKICHETKQPIYISKNGYNDLVILSNEAYENYEEERIEKIISEYIDKKYPDINKFKQDVCKKIEFGLKEKKEGKYFPAQEVFKEMEGKYNINE